MSKINLYAEVLTHIRQLTLHASLETEKNEETTINLSSDKKIITLVHDGESSSIYLPTQISGTAQITFPYQRKSEISARVQIDDLAVWKEHGSTGIEVPWSASELRSQTEIQCRKCESQILSPGTINTWKDLPNHDWAEIMDMWYCHKPHEHHDNDQQKRAAEAKGYSATSKIASVQGVGMVDLVSFALHPGDCKNIKVIETEETSHESLTPVLCTACADRLGTKSSAGNLIRLNKAALGVRPAEHDAIKTHPPSTFVCAQLLSLIESSTVRKVVVHCVNTKLTQARKVGSYKDEGKTDRPSTVANDESESGQASQSARSKESEPSTSETPQVGLLLWIFNPDIYFSSSMHPSSQSTASNPIANAHRAMKIFYKTLDDPIFHLDSQASNSIEELALPTQTDFDDLHSALKLSTAMLPHSTQAFQDWTVGLLERYERDASARMVMGENPLARNPETDQITRWSLPAGYSELYV